MSSNNLMIEIGVLLEKLKKGKIDLDKKEKLYDIVKSIEQCTETQKRRFILYYNLNNDNETKMSLEGIGKIENCTGNAVRQAIYRVTCRMARLKGEKRDILLNILKENEN